MFPLSVIPLASVIGAILADKGTDPPRDRWFHGTSATAVPLILREGFKAGTEHGPWTLFTALAWFATRPWKKVSEAEWEATYRLFMDDAAVPMPGYIYLSRGPDNVLTRGQDDEGGSYVFEVELTGDVVPDEDWIGEALAGLVQSNLIPSPSHPEDLWAFEVLEKLSPELRRAVEVASHAHDPLSNFEWAALVGKAVVAELEQSPEGREWLARGVVHAKKIAHRGSPRVFALWRNDLTDGTYTDSTGLIWKVPRDRWVRIPLHETALVTR